MTDRPSLLPSSCTGHTTGGPHGPLPSHEEHSRLTTFRTRTMHGLGSASPPVALLSASGEFRAPEPTTIPFGQASQHLWLSVDHDVYQRFTCVNHTMLRPSS